MFAAGCELVGRASDTATTARARNDALGIERTGWWHPGRGMTNFSTGVM